MTLKRPKRSDESKPQFLQALILPDRGMDIFQIRAFLPGRGEIDLLASPSLAEARKQMNGGPEDVMGNKTFAHGGAILLPYANRIRGKLQPDGTTLETNIAGKTVMLPANWIGKNPGAERCAMHGLILAANFQVQEHSDNQVTALLHADNFANHWLSKTDVTVQAGLQDDSFAFTVDAKNVGSEPLPMGIGWHPYFALPSGKREQARMHVPARQRGLVTNYDDVFPTGQTVPVRGTPYDFMAAGGAPLNKLFMDDTFVDVQKDAQGHTVAEIIDPAAKYGLRITATAPEISAIQVYAPPDKSFIVLEPQTNWADPYGSEWKGKKTGMVTLAPGQALHYEARLEMFTP